MADHTVPLPRRVSESAWHYTNAAGLLGILKSQRLWATAPQVLNDTGELAYGIEQVRAAWSSLRDSVRASTDQIALIDRIVGDGWAEGLHTSAFVVSASNKGNLLSQWRSYAAVDGFAIQLDLRETKWIALPDPNESGQPWSVAPMWNDVIYDPAAQREAAVVLLTYLATLEQRWFDNLPDFIPAFVLSSLPLLFKHEAFDDEREVRWIGSGTDVKFRASNQRLVPYVDVCMWDGNGTPQPQKLPIVSITCGPACRPGTTAVVERLLTSVEMEGVKVLQSEIPFTDR